MNEFAGKVAVVTGAASGIGEGLARHCAGEGMKVVLADVNAERVEALASELGAEWRITDVSKAEELEALADFAFDQFG